MFEESADHVFITHVEPLASESMEHAPPRLSSTNGGSLPAKQEQDGTLRPLSTSYLANAPLDNRHQTKGS